MKDRDTGGATILALAAVAASAVVLGGVLWLVTVPLLSRATAASLAIATGCTAWSALEQVWVQRRGWREAWIQAAIIFVIGWPLVWLMVTYTARKG